MFLQMSHQYPTAPPTMHLHQAPIGYAPPVYPQQDQFTSNYPGYTYAPMAPQSYPPHLAGQPSYHTSPMPTQHGPSTFGQMSYGGVYQRVEQPEPVMQQTSLQASLAPAAGPGYQPSSTSSHPPGLSPDLYRAPFHQFSTPDFGLSSLSITSPGGSAGTHVVPVDSSQYSHDADQGRPSALPFRAVGRSTSNNVQNVYGASGVAEDQCPPAVKDMEYVVVSDPPKNKRDHHAIMRGRHLRPRGPAPNGSTNFRPSFVTANVTDSAREKMPIPAAPRETKPLPPRLYCPHCSQSPEGFGGQAELDRHMKTKHPSEGVLRWICINPEEGQTKCDRCNFKYQYLYAREDNAASHLRRMHFNKRQNGVGNQNRGGKSGGDYPKLPELKTKGYLKLIQVNVDPSAKWLHGPPPNRRRRRGGQGSVSESGSADTTGSSDLASNEVHSPQEIPNLDSTNVDCNFNASSYTDAPALAGFEEGPDTQSPPWDNKLPMYHFTSNDLSFTPRPFAPRFIPTQFPDIDCHFQEAQRAEQQSIADAVNDDQYIFDESSQFLDPFDGFNFDSYLVDFMSSR